MRIWSWVIIDNDERVRDRDLWRAMAAHFGVCELSLLQPFIETTNLSMGVHQHPGEPEDGHYGHQ